MTIFPYHGNSPSCYTNALLTALKRPDLSLATLETLTGSPFGFQLLFGTLPLFDPPGWTPDLGVDQALTLLGYTWQTRSFDNEAGALAGLLDLLQNGPVFVGPLDMGLLRHQPGSDRATGADHFVTVLDVRDDLVFMHDPQGHPWAALPVSVFLEAWQAEQIGYTQPFTLRTDFQCQQETRPADAVRRSLPLAARWMPGRDDLPGPPGTLGGREGLESLATMIEQDFSDNLRGILISFSIRIGARRRVDAAQTLDALGEAGAAELLQAQARTLGALQYPAITRNVPELTAGLRTFAGLHEELEGLLSQNFGEEP